MQGAIALKPGLRHSQQAGVPGMDSKSQRHIVRNNISLLVMVLTLVALLAVGGAFWLIL